VLIAAANSAAMHRDAPVQTLLQALNKLGSTQSMNLILGLTLKRSARLSDPLLARTPRYWDLSLHTAEYGRTLARMLEVDEGRCYCAGCCIAWATWRCCAPCRSGAWPAANWMKPGSVVAQQFGAPFGSALRTRWRLPLNLRELIAAVYQLGGGVYSREILAMSLAGQLARLRPSEGLEKVASGRRHACSSSGCRS
jgi:HD-like signal output (HDOD) protein